MLLAGVTTSKPDPSRTSVSPGDAPPQMSVSCRGQLVPLTETMRPLLVCASTVTLMPPHAAFDGTVTVNDVAEAWVTVPATGPPNDRNRTVLFVATGSKPSPV